MISSSTFDCPHCSKPVNMDKDERYIGHVSYWGERSPRPMTCGDCEKDFFVQEHVARWWTAGKSEEEASDV